ncbi:MAG: hypothetical protein CMJ81_01870 [Planctomycetaceae bacterium]|nr:hypothetical protein [Planctomycetaceae bacterium]
MSVSRRAGRQGQRPSAATLADKLPASLDSFENWPDFGGVSAILSNAGTERSPATTGNLFHQAGENCCCCHPADVNAIERAPS